MSQSKSNSLFTFAEVVIGAPWATSILAQHHDNDKGDLLHRNNTGDEWSGRQGLEVERQARQLRAAALAEAFGRITRRLAALLRPARA